MRQKIVTAILLTLCTFCTEPLNYDVQSPATAEESVVGAAGVSAVLITMEPVIADIDMTVQEFHAASMEEAVSEEIEPVTEVMDIESIRTLPTEEDIEKGAKYADLYANSIIDDAYLDMIVEICSEYNMDPYLIAAQCECESSGNPNDVSSSNAIGLMQIIRKYHTERISRLGIDDLYDPYSNLLVGIDFMSELLDKYDTKTALMCYNEGEFSGARSRAKEGHYSSYAKKVVKRAEELRS